MTADTSPTRSEIVHTLSRWKIWLRLHRAVRFFTLGFGIGAAAGWAAGVAGILTARILQAEFVRLVPSIGIILGLLLGLAGYLAPIPIQRAARYFDRLLNLKERVSTALELRSIPITSRNSVERLQIEDANRAMQDIRIQERLRLQPDWRAVLAGALFILVVGPTSLYGESAFQLAAKKRSVRSALLEQAAAMDALIEEADASAALAPAIRQETLAALNETARLLEGAESLDSGLAALDAAEALLSELGDPTAGPTIDRLRIAASAVKTEDPGGLMEQLAAGDLQGAADQLQTIDAAGLSGAENASLADSLEALSMAVQEGSPPLAEALSEASDALRSGNASAAEQGLQSAGDALSALADTAAQTEALAGLAEEVNSAQGQLAATGQTLADAVGTVPAESALSTAGDGSPADGAGPAGSGRGDPAGEAQPGSPTSDDPIDLANDPSDLGQQAFSDLYSPYQAGIDSIPGQSVLLPTGDEPRTLVSGEGGQSPPAPGTSRVPFVEIFPEYENLWRQAMDNGVIPPELISVVQEYFAGLEP